MNFKNMTDTFKEVAAQYKTDMDVAREYIKAKGLPKTMSSPPISTDARDFAPMVALMGIEGNTPQEREQDIIQKVDRIAEAFSDPDHGKRKEYLDILFDFLKTFDLENADMNDSKDVHHVLDCYLLDQTFSQKIVENPEYYQAKYPTVQERNLMDANNTFRASAISFVVQNLRSIPIKIVPGVTISTNVGFPEDVRECSLQFAKNQRDKAQAVMDGKEPDMGYDFPILDSMVPYVGKKNADALNYDKQASDIMVQYFSFVLGDNALISTNKKMQGLAQADMKDYTDALYIDGMTYEAFLQKNFPGKSMGDPLDSNLITTILLSGSHRVDVVHAYPDADGRMQYEAKAMRATFTPEQQEMIRQQEQREYMKQFSWIRRTLFNWGPFRIPPMPQKPEMPADTQMNARHADICKNLKGRLESRLAEKKEKERQNELKNKKEAAAREKIKQAKAKLDDSVEKWEKGSVLEILGRQVKGSYDTIRGNLFAMAEAKRYDAVVEPLAKQMLYMKLWLEHSASKDGQIGPIENRLRGDGDPKTIENNLAQAVKEIMLDPLLKEVFTSKVEEEGILSSTKYDNLIRNGGCQYLASEYMKKQNEAERIKQGNPKSKEWANSIQSEMAIRQI